MELGGLQCRMADIQQIIEAIFYYYQYVVNSATFLYVYIVMRIIAKSTLKKYWDDNPQTESSLLEWLDIVYDCVWETPNEVKATFGNASLLGNNRVIFNIKGNDHRLITKIDYQNKIVFTLWIGTHAEYDKIDAKIIEYVKANKN